MEAWETLQKIIDQSHSMVFFGGAGVSTESGIPDFRSVDGLYNQNYQYPPEEILSHSFFEKKTEEFYQFYKDKMLCLNAQPNQGHKKLARLEEVGKLKAIITQNVDGLHQKAGSKNVLELHGSIHRNFCRACGKNFDGAYIAGSQGVPLCTCGGLIKPDVVLYEESLNQTIISDAVNAIQNADTLIIGGTSLTVYPAAGLINYYQGDKMVVINSTATPRDDRADYIFRENIGALFSKIEI